jgi:outer membrane protein assembly factor BamB
MKFLNILLPTLAVAFLAFLAGSYVMFAEAGPAAFLSNAYKAGQALVDQQTNYRHPYFSRFHQKARTDARGVTIHDPDRAQDGLTLYTSGHDQRAFLVSMNGDVLHAWDLPFSKIWNETSPVKAPLGDEYIYYRRAHLYPNGDLLVIYIASGDTPWGYGAARMTKDSELVWSYLGQAHHDFDVGSDGKVYLLTHEVRHDVIEAWTQLKPPRVDDFIVVLSPEGEELKKVDVTKALIDSTYGRMLTRIPWYSEQSGDYLHTNAIDVIEAADAKVFPFGKEGDVLISMRELTTGAIAVVDMEEEVFSWATQGSWAGQHDPDITKDGNILLFDNRGEFGKHGTARVIEFDPRNDGIVWKYSGSAEHPFESVLRSIQSRLPNGNTLITESDGGRLFEVTPEGEIVWEFINPVRGGDNDEFIPIVSSGERIDPKTLEREFLQSLSKPS